MAEAELIRRLLETGGTLGAVLIVGYLAVQGIIKAVVPLLKELIALVRDFLATLANTLREISAAVKDVSRSQIEMRADMADMRRDTIAIRRDVDVLFAQRGIEPPSRARERGGKTEGERGE